MSRRATTVAVALCAGVAAAALVACAARSGATPQAVPSLQGRPDDLRAQIRELDAKITGDLSAPPLAEAAPDRAAVEAAAGVSMADLHTTCMRSERETCQDVCKLGDSICDSAKTICDLAAQLPGDAWAADRCSSGKASCQRANDRCCSC